MNNYIISSLCDSLGIYYVWEDTNVWQIICKYFRYVSVFKCKIKEIGELNVVKHHRNSICHIHNHKYNLLTVLLISCCVAASKDTLCISYLAGFYTASSFVCKKCLCQKIFLKVVVFIKNRCKFSSNMYDL